VQQPHRPPLTVTTERGFRPALTTDSDPHATSSHREGRQSDQPGYLVDDARRAAEYFGDYGQGDGHSRSTRPDPRTSRSFHVLARPPAALGRRPPPPRPLGPELAIRDRDAPGAKPLCHHGFVIGSGTTPALHYAAVKSQTSRMPGSSVEARGDDIVPAMPTVNISVTTRTTSDNVGLPRMIVAGNGGTVYEALQNLAELAEKEADKIAKPFHGTEYLSEPDVMWPFEVVDVQLVPVPLADGDSWWIAYGTLASDGATPWSNSPS
jgi:hypothetical protein